ncbi:MAG TPA: hypothetical protein VH143_29630 [Kofleriaceae bacterium]|jgi:hypothetical protein|nr:hypothetical protein [Kofleriaceae bacterium]
MEPVRSQLLFTRVLNNALRDGLVGVALVDREGHVMGRAGEIDDDEAMPMTTLVMMRVSKATGDLSERLFAGEIVVAELDRGDVAVGVAGRQLFVVAVLGSGDVQIVDDLRRRVEAMLADDEPRFVPTPGSGGSGGSGPDSLALVELGITVPRAKA